MIKNAKNKKAVKAFALLCCLGSLNTSEALTTHLHPVISLGGGIAATSNVGNSIHFPIVNTASDEFYNYTASHSTQENAFYDIFIGNEWRLNSSLGLQAGVDYNQIHTFKAAGTLLQGIDIPSADQYSYHFRLLSRQLLAEGKFFYSLNDRFYPYFLLGLGVAFNKSYDFQTSVPPFLTFTRQYSNHMKQAFSYLAGVGIDIAITPHWRAGVAYRFTDLGKVSLGPASINGIPVSGTLSQTHFYVNEAMAQLSWIY